MCLIARSHALFKDHARLRLMYRLHTSLSFTVPSRTNDRATLRHSFALVLIMHAVSTFRSRVVLNLSTSKLYSIPAWRLSSSDKSRIFVIAHSPTHILKGNKLLDKLFHIIMENHRFIWTCLLASSRVHFLFDSEIIARTCSTNRYLSARR